MFFYATLRHVSTSGQLRSRATDPGVVIGRAKKQQKYRHINIKQPKEKQKQQKYQQKAKTSTTGLPPSSLAPCTIWFSSHLRNFLLIWKDVTDLLFCKLKSLIPSIFAGSHVVHDAGAVCQNLNRRLEGGDKHIISILLCYYIIREPVKNVLADFVC